MCGEDVSTAELLREIGVAMGKPARLISVPPSFLSLAAILLGRRSFAERFLVSLQVDISKTSRLLGWEPIVSIDAELKKTVEGFLREASI